MTEVTDANRKLFAYCCAEAGGDPEACDCVNKDHGMAVYEATCLMVNCRNRAPADEAFCVKHRGKDTRKAMTNDEKLAIAGSFECGYQQGYEDGKHDGRSDERKAIVKWLREQDGHGYDDMRASLIEDGEHLK